ncbi:MAG TPA: Xaa-Pro peptidase family protein [Longimicrobiales bacterium]
MKRRQFIQAGVLGAGAVTVLGAEACAAGANPDAAGAEDLPPPIAALQSRRDEAPPPITEEERAGRRARAQELMAEAGVDALFIEPGASLTYFADVRWGRSERTFGLLLRRRGEPVVICPAFERGRAENATGGRFEIRVWQEDESPFALIGRAVRDGGRATGRLALEETTRYFVVQGLARDAGALELVSGDPITHRCRGVKSAHEIEIMRFANRITLEAIEAAFASLREGTTQRELGGYVRAAFERLGFGGGWVLPLIGESSAYPHGSDNPKPLGPGDVVLIDAGTSVHGYQADVTRTIAFGTASTEVRAVFEVVREAQARALEFAAPGRTCGEVDAVARKVVADAGHGAGFERFTHRLGHGIGLEGHEWPYLVRNSDIVLEPGMTFSDEPGIYQYGKFGVRLEDVMVITETGAELLTGPAASLA